MSDKDEILPSALLEIMKSPQVGEILSSLRTSGEEGAENGAQASAQGLSLPPDFMEKLPSVISALFAMGLGSPQSQTKDAKPPSKGNEQRKALLKALKPYLSPKRQSVVDGMLGLESLTGLLGAVGGGKEEK